MCRKRMRMFSDSSSCGFNSRSEERRVGKECASESESQRKRLSKESGWSVRVRCRIEYMVRNENAAEVEFDWIR